MSICEGDGDYIRGENLSPLEERAWSIYCKETSGDMDARDYWSQLPVYVQEIYLKKAGPIAPRADKPGPFEVGQPIDGISDQPYCFECDDHSRCASAELCYAQHKGYPRLR